MKLDNFRENERKQLNKLKIVNHKQQKELREQIRSGAITQSSHLATIISKSQQLFINATEKGVVERNRRRVLNCRSKCGISGVSPGIKNVENRQEQEPIENITSDKDLDFNSGPIQIEYEGPDFTFLSVRPISASSAPLYKTKSFRQKEETLNRPKTASSVQYMSVHPFQEFKARNYEMVSEIKVSPVEDLKIKKKTFMSDSIEFTPRLTTEKELVLNKFNATSGDLNQQHSNVDNITHGTRSIPIQLDSIHHNDILTSPDINIFFEAPHSPPPNIIIQFPKLLKASTEGSQPTRIPSDVNSFTSNSLKLYSQSFGLSNSVFNTPRDTKNQNTKLHKKILNNNRK